MKALAVDSASTKMSISASNDGKTCSEFAIGMQTRNPAPHDRYVLKRQDSCERTDYTVLCKGPGSFTGLRLAFAALKSIEMAYQIPVYGVPTLDAYAYQCFHSSFTAVPVIDAKKDRFYASGWCNGTRVFDDGDYEPADIIKKIGERPTVACGPDASYFCRIVREKFPSFDIQAFELQPTITGSLFILADRMIERHEPSLKDFEGPLYLRASEAEEALIKK